MRGCLVLLLFTAAALVQGQTSDQQPLAFEVAFDFYSENPEPVRALEVRLGEAVSAAS